MFVVGLVLVLWPILFTNVAADDLLNPFSQLYHTGTNPFDVIEARIKPVAATGHFNYIGQPIGGLVLTIWIFFIGQMGVHFILVYATTKLIAYILIISVSAWLLQLFSQSSGITLPKLRANIMAALALSLTLQIHIPWSNDPVSSYPLAGFVAASLGLVFVGLAHLHLGSANMKTLAKVGAFGLTIILYYELNLFAVMACAPLLLRFLWESRFTKASFLSGLGRGALVFGPSFAGACLFFGLNKGGSSNYTGTQISLTHPFASTFQNSIVSSLPGSSWGIATEWLGQWPNLFGLHLLPFFGALALFAGSWWSCPASVQPGSDRVPRLRKAEGNFCLLALLIFWVGATLSQSVTVKVQQEVLRVGQVYTFYAVGSSCVSLFFLAYLSRFRLRRAVVQLLFLAALVLGATTYAVNSAVMIQFNKVTASTRELLDSIDPALSDEIRCGALAEWKSAGWPEYYWLDMELGLQRLGEKFWGKRFCGQ